MKTVRMIMMAAALTVVWTFAFGEQAPIERHPGSEMGPDGPGRAGPPSKEKREEVRKKVEAIRIYRLTEALDLDEKTSAKVASLLGSIDRKRREVNEQSQASLRELRLALKNSHPDQSKLKSLLEKIERSDHETAELRLRETEGLKEVLTIEQQARYVIFQRDFAREMRNMIAGARVNRPGAGHGPGNTDQSASLPGNENRTAPAH